MPENGKKCQKVSNIVNYCQAIFPGKNARVAGEEFEMIRNSIPSGRLRTHCV